MDNNFEKWLIEKTSFKDPDHFEAYLESLNITDWLRLGEEYGKSCYVDGGNAVQMAMRRLR